MRTLQELRNNLKFDSFIFPFPEVFFRGAVRICGLEKSESALNLNLIHNIVKTWLNHPPWAHQVSEGLGAREMKGRGRIEV